MFGIENVNSLRREARGPQVTGGNKTTSGRLFFFSFLLASNPVLSC